MPQQPPFINFNPVPPPDGDLIEAIGNYSPASATWSKREVSDTLVYDVMDAKWGDFLMFMLGTESVSPSTRLLHRTPPFGHPKYSYLYAQRVSEAQGVKYTGRDDNAGQAFIDQGLTQANTSVAKYRHTHAHVEFGQPMKRIYTDAQIVGSVDIWNNDSANPTFPRIKRTVTTQQEWLRNCDWYGWEPYGDFISLEGSTVSFAEGSLTGSPIPSPIGYPISKANKKIIWYDVPFDYIMFLDPQAASAGLPFGTAGVPQNILAGINHVNEYDWFGFKAGTLLADPPKLMPHISPVSVGLDPVILFDIEFNFRYLSPPYEVTNSALARGHQTLPNSKNGLWNYVTRSTTGDPAAPPLYPTFPFSYFFLPPFGIYWNNLSKWNQ